jgi:hypothetical protein
MTLIRSKDGDEEEPEERTTRKKSYNKFLDKNKFGLTVFIFKHHC